jgi:hypothetical protein
MKQLKESSNLSKDIMKNPIVFGDGIFHGKHGVYLTLLE